VDRPPLLTKNRLADESKTRLLARADAPIDSLFFRRASFFALSGRTGTSSMMIVCCVSTMSASGMQGKDHFERVREAGQSALGGGRSRKVLLQGPLRAAFGSRRLHAWSLSSPLTNQPRDRVPHRLQASTEPKSPGSDHRLVQARDPTLDPVSLFDRPLAPRTRDRPHLAVVVLSFDEPAARSGSPPSPGIDRAKVARFSSVRSSGMSKETRRL
jgi:hypothetical protein